MENLSNAQILTHLAHDDFNALELNSYTLNAYLNHPKSNLTPVLLHDYQLMAQALLKNFSTKNLVRVQLRSFDRFQQIELLVQYQHEDRLLTLALHNVLIDAERGGHFNVKADLNVLTDLNGIHNQTYHSRLVYANTLANAIKVCVNDVRVQSKRQVA